MGRRLALLVLLVPLAVSAAAEARSKSVKVRMPAEGDISFARYLVRTTAPKDLTVRNARRLGTSMVVTAARTLSRRRYEVTVMMVNPEGGASAAQAGSLVELIFESAARTRISLAGVAFADSFLNEPVTADEIRAVNRLCARKPPRRITRRIRRSRGFFESRGGSAGNRRSVRVLFAAAACQDEVPGATLAASDGLKAVGVKVPPCTGTARRDPANSKEAAVELICTEGANFITVRAQDGNVATNCAGPPDSICRVAQQCGPAGPESSCHLDPNDFDLRTPFTLRTAWQADPDISSVRASTRAQNAQMPTDLISLYLRLLDRS